MKKPLFLFSLLILAALGFSQVIIESGSHLIVSNGTKVIAVDGIVNNDGSINNSGTVEIKGDLENNTSALTTTGSTGTVIFNGSTAQEITGDHDAEFYGIVEIDNSNGVAITNTTTGADQTINGTLVFTDGSLTLNEFDIILANDATTPGSTKYIQTNSTGVVTRNVPADGATDVVFPVGNNAYNPITLQNSGAATADDYSVRVVDAEPIAGSTPHYVDRSWVITEGITGGSELSVTPQWNLAEELTDFDRTNSNVGLTTDGGTSYQWTETSAATGTNPYYLSGSTFTGVGTFAIGDYYNSGKIFDLQLILAGAFNGTDMNKDLNTDGLIPLTDPYGLSTTVTAVPADAVDWVKIELRAKTDNTSVLHSFARFVDINGQVIEEDGTNFKITGAVMDYYYVAVKHRNHLAIVSFTSVNLNVDSPDYDFTTGQAQAWQDGGITTNDAMKDVSGVFCLWEGDATANGFVAYNGGSNDRIAVLNSVGASTPGGSVLNTYALEDVNMDGDIYYNGGGNDRITILNVVGAGSPGAVVEQHLP